MTKIIYALCFFILPLAAMEQTKSERKKPVYYIAPEIQKELRVVDKEWTQQLRSIKPVNFKAAHSQVSLVNSWCATRYAEIISASGNKMSRQSKLKYLIGDSYYDDRKKIIKEMIELEQIHPDDIDNFGGMRVLYESVTKCDNEFIEYLYKHGADLKYLYERPYWIKDKKAYELLTTYMQKQTTSKL